MFLAAYVWNIARRSINLFVLCLLIQWFPFFAFGQYVVKGTITDTLKTPLVGVHVQFSPFDWVTTTDLQGIFTFKIKDFKEGQPTYYGVTMRYIGFETIYKHIPTPLGGKFGDYGDTIYIDTIQMKEAVQMLEELVLHVTRADYNTPMTVTNLNKADIRRNNVGVDLPYLLDLTPSVVVNSDAGAGVGYTGIRIRGSDPTRTNITINGIPLNDAESQGTFLVNLPDFASSVNQIQIQRGVGTSTNGAGAFGATVALQTNIVQQKPYAETSHSVGSFNTRKHTIQFGTGLLANHFSIEGRLSHILSDGYINRASSNLKSFYASAAFVNKHTLLRFNMFSGKEITYQAWGGVPIQYVQDKGRTFGYFKPLDDTADSLRRYNPYIYDNEVDDYAQTHYQLHFNQQIIDNLHFNAALHYTKGKGFYEQYRSQDALANYSLSDVVLGDTTITNSDLIRRRWLDNDFYGIIYGLDYSVGRWQLILGGGWNRYAGRHFGEVIWAQYASNGTIRHRYYEDKAIKWDGNTYLKFQMQVTNGLFLYADVQHRYVHYQFVGNTYNAAGEIVKADLDTVMHFFNPKIGCTYNFSSKHKTYLSFAMAHREPNRDDFTNAVQGQFPKAERLYDVELGYNFNATWFQAGINVYYMHYQNQLVLTGQLNDVGAYIRANVPQSYRMGIEIQATMQPAKWINIMGNFTLSRNKIIAWTEYVDNWDTWGQETVMHKNTDIAFSPSMIGSSEIVFFPYQKDYNVIGKTGHKVEIAWLRKMVGKQFIDNTQNNSRALDMYWLHDIRLTYRMTHKIFKEVSINFWVKNLWNAQYSANAWSYRFRSDNYNPTTNDPYTSTDTDGYYNMIGLYPQAGRHFWASLSVLF